MGIYIEISRETEDIGEERGQGGEGRGGEGREEKGRGGWEGEVHTKAVERLRASEKKFTDCGT